VLLVEPCGCDGPLSLTGAGPPGPPAGLVPPLRVTWPRAGVWPWQVVGGGRSVPAVAARGGGTKRLCSRGDTVLLKAVEKGQVGLPAVYRGRLFAHPHWLDARVGFELVTDAGAADDQAGVAMSG